MEPKTTNLRDQLTTSWRRSSRSGPNCDNCVEVAYLATTAGVAVRDSKDAVGPVLTFTRGAWGSFLRSTRQGDFDR